MECYLMAGAFDYMLRVVALEIAGLERFVTKKLTKIAGVRDINTSTALRRVHDKTTRRRFPCALGGIGSGCERYIRTAYVQRVADLPSRHCAGVAELALMPNAAESN